MPQNPVIVFVCEHGAAKSIIAATYFNKIAMETGLEVRAVARGTNPDKELSAKVISGLPEDGLTPTESVPQKLSIEDAESAQQIVSFCELPEEFHKRAVIEQWENIPPVSDNYDLARVAIVEQIKSLIKGLR